MIKQADIKKYEKHKVNIVAKGSFWINKRYKNTLLFALDDCCIVFPNKLIYYKDIISFDVIK